MSELSCAAVLLALGVSGAVSADEARTTSGPPFGYHWHCTYTGGPEVGGVYEGVQRGGCRPSIVHPEYGLMLLSDSYPL